MLYSRPELRLLVALAAILLCGLAVREWRAGFPDLADRLERFDRDDPPMTGTNDARPVSASPGTAEESMGAPTNAAAPEPRARPDDSRPRLDRAGPRSDNPRTQVDGAGARPDNPRTQVDGAGARLDTSRAQVDATGVQLADPRPLDLNRATLAELSRLPGVGPGLAQRIVEERQRRGRFESAESLRSVLGMGPKKLAALRDLVTVGE